MGQGVSLAAGNALVEEPAGEALLFSYFRPAPGCPCWRGMRVLAAGTGPESVGAWSAGEGREVQGFGGASAAEGVP